MYISHACAAVEFKFKMDASVIHTQHLQSVSWKIVNFRGDTFQNEIHICLSEMQ